MKKLISLMLVLACAFCMFAYAEEAAEGEYTEHAEYTIYNVTGAPVVGLYVYEAGSEDKGENLAGDAGLADGECIVVSYEATKEDAETATFVIEFTNDGENMKRFETLHFEVAPVSLLADDAMTGATPISFTEPEQ